MTKRTYKILAVVSFFALLLVSARVVLATSETAQDMALNAVSDYLRANPDKEVALKLLGAVEAAQKGESMIGAYIASPTGLTDLNVTNDLVVDGVTTLTGDTTISGQVTYRESSSNLTATTSITSAMSGKTFYVSGLTSTWTLPATSSAIIGANYRFVVGGALTVTSSIKTASGADEIEGTLIVAGAVVDCDAEDEIVFGAAFENIGDYVEFRWSGTYWMLGDSGALTSGALACTKT